MSYVRDASERDLAPCEKCKANRGDPCRTPSHRTTKPHKGRTAMAPLDKFLETLNVPDHDRKHRVSSGLLVRISQDDKSTRIKAPHENITGIDESVRSADLTFDLYLVGHGIEVEVFSDGKHIGGYCRDFSEDYKIDDLKQRFYTVITQAIKDLRGKL